VHETTVKYRLFPYQSDLYEFSAMKKKVEVVALIICRDRNVLLEKRGKKRRNDPGKIALPGGHLKKQETLLEACRRELKEELDLQCYNFTFVTKILHQTPSEDQTVYYYLCENWKGTPKCNEAEKILWTDIERLERLDFEEDKQAIRELLSLRHLSRLL
jgi:8-oxo-dGTP diphosphatase